MTMSPNWFQSLYHNRKSTRHDMEQPMTRMRARITYIIFEPRWTDWTLSLDHFSVQVQHQASNGHRNVTALALIIALLLLRFSFCQKDNIFFRWTNEEKFFQNGFFVATFSLCQWESVKNVSSQIGTYVIIIQRGEGRPIAKWFRSNK